MERLRTKVLYIYYSGSPNSFEVYFGSFCYHTIDLVVPAFLCNSILGIDTISFTPFTKLYSTDLLHYILLLFILLSFLIFRFPAGGESDLRSMNASLHAMCVSSLYPATVSLVFHTGACYQR